MQEFWNNYHTLVFLLLGATATSFVWLFVFNRKRLNASWWELLIVAILHTLVGVGFVKFFALLEAGFNTEKAGNLSMYGGVFFMPLFYFIYAKIKKLPIALVFDVFVVSLVSTLFFARINCFLSGCCLGKSINYSEYRYPTREAELVFDVIFIGLAIFFLFKGKLLGKIYPIYLISYGVFRFIIEWFRESDVTSGFHIAHVWSFLAVLIGSALLIIQYYLKKSKENK